MSWPRKLLVGLFGIVFVAALAFTIRSVVRHGEVLPGVSVAGVDLGGLGRADATTTVLALEDELATAPVVVIVEGTSFPLSPDQVEFRLETELLVAEALEAGRRSGFGQLTDWLSRRRHDIAPTGRLSEQAVLQLLEVWEEDGIADPPFNGSVRYDDDRIVTDPPRSGRVVDRATVAEMVLAALLSTGDRTAVLDITSAEPALSAADVEAAGRRATELVTDPIVLAAEEADIEVTFRPSQLGAALVSTYRHEPSPRLELSFDHVVIAEQIAPLAGRLEAAPVDAAFEIADDHTVSVVPGRAGTVVDPQLIADQLVAAADFPGRRAPLPYAVGAEPDFTTEEAEDLGIVGRVSDFTTFHACCQPRVTNIQRMADLVDGAIVMPGHEFSLNEHVGRRTEENGFVAAPMILRGEFVPAVGGGISQFATTLFNAVFFGGYEDVFHQPHSYYFTRYPEGREATVSFPNPELIFRNDTEAGMLIKTDYTEDSITVTLYGNNNGRHVADSLSPRRQYRDPVTDYIGDATVVPGTEVVEQRGRQGWTVTVGRTITYADGAQRQEEWDWTYRPQPRVVRVHPCDIPGTTVTCPTTTTTAPPATTTTPVPSTTTSTSPTTTP